MPATSSWWAHAGQRTRTRSCSTDSISSFNPAYVYAVGLHGAGFDVVGNTPFAYPYILFARNADIAWGQTAGPNNVVDIYEEKLNPADPTQYWYNGQYQSMEKRVDAIPVKGGQPVPLEVFRTVHGLVVQIDTANHVAYSKKRSWEGRELSSLLAVIRSMKASSIEEWRDAISNYDLPINNYYADRHGNIGYISAGLLPDRPAGQSAFLPADGTGNMEWHGFLPFSDNPQVYNPPQGVIANWNNKPSPAFRNNDVSIFSRADRVNTMFDELQHERRLSVQEVRDIIQRVSFVDINVDYFLPYLQEAVRKLPKDSRETRAVMLIGAWVEAGKARVDDDHDGFYDAPALPIFREWLGAMLRATLADELDINSPAQAPYFATGYPSSSVSPRIQAGSTNVSIGAKVVLNALLDRGAPVLQRYDFFNGADPLAVVLQALRSALDSLEVTGNSRDPVVPHEFNFRNFVGVPQANPDEFVRLPIYMNRGTQNNLSVLRADGIRSFDVTPPGKAVSSRRTARSRPTTRTSSCCSGTFSTSPRLSFARRLNR